MMRMPTDRIRCRKCDEYVQAKEVSSLSVPYLHWEPVFEMMPNGRINRPAKGVHRARAGYAMAETFT